MKSIREISERDNVSRQAVSKTVASIRVEKGDDWIEFDARGRVARVSVAHYDEYRQRYVNPAKASAPIRQMDEKTYESAGEMEARQNDSFDEARRQNEWIKNARDKLRHQEDAKLLMRADRVREAEAMVGGEIKAIVSRLPNKADDLAATFAAGGVHALRLELRKVATDMLNQIASKMDGIAAAAPDEDELIGDI